jgi:hypothetical protein
MRRLSGLFRATQAGSRVACVGVIGVTGLTVKEGNMLWLSDFATAPVAPEMRYCGQCARPAVFRDGIAELARYVCPLQHLTLLDLTDLQQQQPRANRQDSRRILSDG